MIFALKKPQIKRKKIFKKNVQPPIAFRIDVKFEIMQLSHLNVYFYFYFDNIHICLVKNE